MRHMPHTTPHLRTHPHPVLTSQVPPSGGPQRTGLAGVLQPAVWAFAGVLSLAGCTTPPGGTTQALQTATSAQTVSFMPPEPPSGYTPKALSHSQRDMVAAAHPLAVQAGVAMLAYGVV